MKVDGPIDSFTERRKSRNQTIAELIAVDGFTMNQIINSAFLKKCFKLFGWEMPANATTITNIVVDEAKQKENLMKNEIGELKKQGVRFSCVIDEWTSLSNARFMSVNVCSPEKRFNCGLAEIHGSANATNLNSTLEARLNIFSLTIKELVCITSDGASVMKSMASQNSCLTQICMNHGSHLAVKDAFSIAQNTIVDSDQLDEDEIEFLDTPVKGILFYF